jgi:hypothetical protein
MPNASERTAEPPAPELGHVLEILNKPISALRAARDWERGEPVSPQELVCFNYLLLSRSNPPASVYVSSGVSRREQIDEARSQMQLLKPTANRAATTISNPQRPIELYFETSLRLFRTWAIDRPNSNRWSAKNQELAAGLQRSLRRIILAAGFPPDGFEQKQFIRVRPSDTIADTAAEVSAYLLFWKHVLTDNDERGIKFCRYKPCGNPFLVTGKKDTYCDQDCGKTEQSIRARRRGRCESNYDRLQVIVTLLSKMPAGKDWKNWVLNQAAEHTNVTLRWLSDLEKDASAPSNRECLEAVVSRIFDAELKIDSDEISERVELARRFLELVKQNGNGKT